MSLSKPSVKNPCKKFIEFKGDTGVFRYWDKAAKANVELKYPIQFIVLDELCTVKGYCDQVSSGVYSNEVRGLKHQTLHVKTFKGNLSVSGKYADIKDKIATLGGKFCKSVYAALITGDGLELVNFQLTGIAFKSWIDKECDVSLVSVTVSDCKDGKKGKVQYKIPNYIGASIDKKLMDKAVEMDRELQKFLDEAQNKSHSQIDEAVQADASDLEEDPFANKEEIF